MLDKHEVAAFFDRLASSWDETCTHDPEKITMILDYAGVEAGISVLDVACGTGVLFPYYLARGVKQITGVDISPKMIELAAAKYADPRIRLLCADIETKVWDDPFDCCVIYSAFPHFGRPASLIAGLAKTLRPGGRLTVAHSESMEKINCRHRDHAAAVSVPLLPPDKLAELLAPFFTVDTAMADENIYVISGIKS
jgi:ubiquinone/menaquinone biosynthesis C-methylase UbiE